MVWSQQATIESYPTLSPTINPTYFSGSWLTFYKDPGSGLIYVVGTLTRAGAGAIDMTVCTLTSDFAQTQAGGVNIPVTLLPAGATSYGSALMTVSGTRVALPAASGVGDTYYVRSFYY